MAVSGWRRRLCLAIDHVDHNLGKVGLAKRARFADLDLRTFRALYAGRLSRHLPQYSTAFLGLTPFFPSSRNIDHDASEPLPIPADYLDVYQSEDVFEHIEYNALPAVLDDIHRALRPGGLFRLSVPDYGFDQYRERSLRDERGEIFFDPGGGGAFRNGQVVDGGHVWFPTYELVRALFAASRFGVGSNVRFLQHTAPDGSFIMEPIDLNMGYIQRVPGNDARVADCPRPISIVVDARKV